MLHTSGGRRRIIRIARLSCRLSVQSRLLLWHCANIFIRLRNPFIQYVDGDWCSLVFSSDLCVNNHFYLSSSSVEDLNIPGSITKGGDVCMNDYIAVESCVPEGGARFCGNDSGISRKENNKKTKNNNQWEHTSWNQWLNYTHSLSNRSLQFPTGSDSHPIVVSFRFVR